jgi:exopolysaccharide biosynthesis WecB/TagA/CpsF family protein
MAVSDPARGAAPDFVASERLSQMAGNRVIDYNMGSKEVARSILGVPVLVADQRGAAAAIDRRIDRGETTRVCFLNSNLANHASAQPDLAMALQNFLVLNDGVAVDFASYILYRRYFPQNLNGTDFVPFFLENTKHKLRIYLLGASPPVVERAAHIIGVRWPRHSIVGFHHGFLSDQEEGAIVQQIGQLDPDLVLVGMGNPRQELWLAKRIPDVCRCGFGVGALFDFLSGNVPRAPGWIRRARLEWLYRFSLEPSRLWQRYTFDMIAFFGRIVSEASHRK